LEQGYDTLRLAFFGGVLVAMVALETILPWRDRQQRVIRWPSNLGVVVVSSVIVRLVFPITAAGVAVWAQHSGFGLFHWLGAPFWLALILSILALDCLIYAQHAAFHHVPMLWRLHRMHHTDTVLDATTGTRFHPIEILLSMAIKCIAVALLGAPAMAVLIFEILLNATAMFNHANIRLPKRLDRVLRLFLVTPDMHRVHHSVERDETDSNFGFNLPWWDFLFGTYKPAPKAGLEGMTIGIDAFRDPGEQRIDRLLTQPFRDSPLAERKD
jgi:sterol desaturase/sphingolipid hydroxylase (fatty acid hydroxylase superfamily)